MQAPQKKWRVAFIGAGAIVQNAHIPAFQRLKNVQTVAVCDVNRTRVEQVAAEMNIPASYTESEEMLERERPDITVVATPNVFHSTMTIRALEAGSHVLCEKPLALNLADAKQMYDVAEAQGRVLSVGTHFRFSDAIQMTKAHVDAGFFGDIYAVRTLWQRRAGIPGFGSWFTNRDLAGGGVLLDLGVHALDRALYLMGYPKPVSASGVTFAQFGPRGQGLGGWGSDLLPRATTGTSFDVDYMAWAFIRFSNVALIQFQVACASHYPEEFFTQVYGTNGGGYIGNRDRVELYQTLNQQQVTVQLPLPAQPAPSYPRLIEHFVRHLDGDPTAEIVTKEQALTFVAIVDAITRSAEEGGEVAVEL